MKPKLNSSLLILCAALVFACSSGVPVAVVNQSGHTLRNVTLSGSGFSEHIPSVPAGETVTLYIHPKGESGVAVAFELGTKKFAYPENGYFEGGGAYAVSIAVAGDGTTSVDSKLDRY